jgi:hypothetical protein
MAIVTLGEVKGIFKSFGGDVGKNQMSLQI